MSQCLKPSALYIARRYEIRMMFKSWRKLIEAENIVCSTRMAWVLLLYPLEDQKFDVCNTLKKSDI